MYWNPLGKGRGQKGASKPVKIWEGILGSGQPGRQRSHLTRFWGLVESLKGFM